MFTGLVQGMGKICARQERDGDLQIAIDASALNASAPNASGKGEITLVDGESIAVNGVCLTATHVNGMTFSADVSNATLAATTMGDLAVGAMVNLERSLVLGQALGGHLVSGHVDAIGEVLGLANDGRSWRMQVAVPSHLSHLLAVKGSVCVDGVSLTVNEVTATGFGVNIVPHTMAVTTFGGYRPGTRVNIEMDIIARYLERLLAGREGEAGKVAGTIDVGLLARLGFGEGQK